MPDPLDAIRLPELPPPDVTAEKEEGQFEADADQDLRRIRNLSLQQDIGLRRVYAWCVFALILGWLVCVLAILVCQGFGVEVDGHVFRLDDSVLLALIGGTTVNVVGVFAIVVNYLFPRHARVS